MIIEAICVNSQEIKRKQIEFDLDSGLIKRVGDLGISRNKVDYYYDDNHLLFAGMGDVHIHAREDLSGLQNYKEDFTSARAALHNGGLVHAGDMPNNKMPPVDDESYIKKFSLALSKTQGEIWPYAGIGPGTRPLSFDVPYKVYMGPSIGELFFRDHNALNDVLEFYRGKTVSFHCEDPVILEDSKKQLTHYERRPEKAEYLATKDALVFIERFNLKGKLCHFSTASGFALIQEARKRGLQVEVEVTPNHLFFSEEELNKIDEKKYQMNPPIRKKHDRDVLMKALLNGEVNYLATDHAPHTHEEKEQGISGLTGLDTYVGFVSYLISKNIDLKILSRVVSENPGIFFNNFLKSWKNKFSHFDTFGEGTGFLLPGYRASFTILNMKVPTVVTEEFLKTKVKHSPFLGYTFPGSLSALFIGGNKV